MFCFVDCCNIENIKVCNIVVHFQLPIIVKNTAQSQFREITTMEK